MTIVSHPLYFSPFPRLKIKLKGHHFDTTNVIEAKSQAVLNNLTEHYFRDAFKNGRSAGNGAYRRKGSTSRVMVASRPKISSRPYDSTRPACRNTLVSNGKCTRRNFEAERDPGPERFIIIT
jgi:hypothetical protein